MAVSPTIRPVVAPFAYDVAALKACVGGAFYPGIEVSWQIRQPSLFIEPFRISHDATSSYVLPVGTVEGTRIVAGHFSRQMAQPWQADFAACRKEVDSADLSDDTEVGWWPAQRPDDAYPQGTTDITADIIQPWARPDPVASPPWTNGTIRYNHMVNNWYKFGFVTSTAGPGGATPAYPQPAYGEQERDAVP